MKEAKHHVEQVVEHIQIKESEADRVPEARPTNSGDPSGSDTFRIHTLVPKPRVAVVHNLGASRTEQL